MEKPDRLPRPLNKRESVYLENISKNIKDAVDNANWDTAHSLRTQIIDAAESGVISIEDAINAALTPFFKERKEKKSKQVKPQ